MGCPYIQDISLISEDFMKQMEFHLQSRAKL